LWAHVQEAIELLPAGMKAVLILRDIEGGSAEEACELLQLSAENQRVLLHRARGRVRKAIDLLTATPRSAAAGRTGAMQTGAMQTGATKPGGTVARLMVAGAGWLLSIIKIPATDKP
jgi:hypothetical protein